jgi:hypothetical protein
VKYSTAIKTRVRDRAISKDSFNHAVPSRVAAVRVVFNAHSRVAVAANKVVAIPISDVIIIGRSKVLAGPTGQAVDQAVLIGPNVQAHLLSAVAKTKKSIKKKYRKKSGKHRLNLQEQVVAERA